MGARVSRLLPLLAALCACGSEDALELRILKHGGSYSGLGQSPLQIELLPELELVIAAWGDDGLLVYTLSDPAELPLVASVLPRADAALQVQGEEVLALDSVNGQMHRASLADPVAPAWLGSRTLPATGPLVSAAQDADTGLIATGTVNGELALLAPDGEEDVIQVGSMDFGDEDLVELSFADGMLWVSGPGTVSLDLTQPASPAPLAWAETGAYRSVRDGDLLYTVGYHGLFVLDVADPADMHILSHTRGPTSGVARWGDRLASVSSEDELMVLDVADPAAPILLGSVLLEDCGASNAHDLVIWEDWAYVACKPGVYVIAGLAG